MRLSHKDRTERAVATIISVQDHTLANLIDGNQYTDGGRTPWREGIRVRVKPEGGAEFDSEATVRHHSSFACEARGTYVLYDPEHPEHCDIDYDRLEREFGLTDLSCFPAPQDGVNALRTVPPSAAVQPAPRTELRRSALMQRLTRSPASLRCTAAARSPTTSSRISSHT
jgi:hypothetical protein